MATSLMMTAGGVPVGASSTTSPTLAGYATATQVLAAVTAAESVTKIPKNLTPSFTSIVNGTDFGDSSLIGSTCPFTIPEVWSSVAKCTFGDIHATKTVALIGDSRARMYLDTMNKLGQLEKFKLVYLALSACPTAIGDFGTNVGTILAKPWDLCNNFHTFVIASMKRLKPNLILIMSDNEVQLTHPLHQAGPAEMITDFKKYYGALPNKQHVIAYINYPQPGEVHTPDACLAKLPSNIQNCSFTPSVGVSTNDSAQFTAALQSGIRTVNQRPWYCAKVCPPIINGIAVYTYDSYHTTYQYTQYLMGVMWSTMQPYL